MPTRRQGREWIVQILFELDMNPRPADEALSDFWRERLPDPKLKAFVGKVVHGVIADKTSLDALIKNYARNWEISRMGIVDRNVMRMAIYEMSNCDDVPLVVSINEAVDLAKYFSSNESGKFVNGILDRALRDLNTEDNMANAPTDADMK